MPNFLVSSGPKLGNWTGERDWFHTPSDRFFRFYTRPEITVYCEAEHEDVDYRETLFFQINQTILAGGFDTFDLG